MYIRNSKIFTIACFILLITACSNEPSIKSASSEEVIIGGPPEKFTAAYELAKNECLKYTKTAEYIPDNTADLSEVTFNCVGSEVEATEETATAAVEESETEEAPTETEEILDNAEETAAEETP